MSKIYDETFEERRDRLKRERPPSQHTGQMSCNRCGVCCMISPCQLGGMEDVKKIAEHLGISQGELITTKLRSEWLRMPQGKFRVVTPRRAESGSCVFYDDANRACGIQPVKPAGGVKFECWTRAGRMFNPLHWTEEQMEAMRDARSS